MRLVCLTPWVPRADLPHAGGTLLHHRLVEAARSVEVLVLAPRTARNEADAAHVDAATVVLLDPDHVEGGRGTTARALGGAALGCLDRALPTVRRALGARAGELLRPGDAVEAHWAEYLPLLPVLREAAPGAVTGVFLHDLLSQARAGRAANPLVWWPERVAYRVGARRLQARERALLRHADVVHVLKEEDRRLLEHLPGRVLVAQPWLQRPEHPPGPAAEPVVLFVGAMWREENGAAALWLLDRVWPRVRAAVPDARLRLVGDGPPPVVARRDGRDGVRVTGYVAGLDPEYRAARLAVAPLSTRTGLKIKVPQAMAHGLPVVVRPAAAAGLADAPADVLAGRTDDPAAFADAVVALLRDREAARAAGERARQWVLGRFDLAADVRAALEAYAAVTPVR